MKALWIILRAVAVGLGVIAVLLGGLWLLQGLAIVRIKPILCFADCLPLEGPSVSWAASGAIAMAVGVLVLVLALRRRHSAA